MDRTPNQLSNRTEPDNSKLENQNGWLNRLRRVSRVSAGLGAGAAMLVACASPSSEAKGPETEPTPTSTTIESETTRPELDPTDTDVIEVDDPNEPQETEQPGESNLTKEEREALVFEFDTSSYPFIVDGETFNGGEEVIDRYEMTLAEFPARDQEGKEALAGRFMDIVYKIGINGGLTEEEYSTQEGPNSMLIDEDHQGLVALQIVGYDRILTSLLSPTEGGEWNSPSDPNTFGGLIHQQSLEQIELYRSTAQNTDPANASYELLGAEEVPEIQAQIVGTERADNVVLNIVYNDADGLNSELRGVLVEFEAENDPNGDGEMVWKVREAIPTNILGTVQTGN